MYVLFSALVLLSLVTGGYGRCSSSQEVKDEIMLHSPGYPQERSRHSCKTYRATYKSPPGTTLSMECADFAIQCRGQSNYLLVTGSEKKCGKSFPKATTLGNVLKVKYTARFNRAPVASKRTMFKFKCKIEVRYPEPSFSTCDCPVQEPVATTRATKGRNAVEGEFPYVVAIVEKDIYKCGGSLITEKWVVTSALCDASKRNQVRMGFVSLREVSPNEVYRNIKSVTAHPGYNSETHRYNIALVELDKAVEFTSFIRPICLPDDFLEDSLEEERVVAVGWGDENFKLSDKLQKLNFAITTNSKCPQYEPTGLLAVTMFDDVMCVLPDGGTSCEADGGNPLIYERGGKVYLVGVTSYTNEGCKAYQSASVFVRVSSYSVLSWIRDTTDEICDNPTETPSMAPYSCDECGKRMPQFGQTRILGGKQTLVGEFPYHVVLATDTRVFCGGSLISPRWVLTSAQCAPSKYIDTVMMEKSNTEDARESHNKLILNIARVVIHPKFDALTFQFDIALLELQKYVNFTDYIKPVCLPDNIAGESFANMKGIATGWGAQHVQAVTYTTPRKVTLDIISNAECHAIDKELVYATSICTHTIGKDTCSGDTGGPLTIEQDGRFYQIGVTSWGHGCGSQDWPRVYTRVSHPSILFWVKTITGITCNAP